MKKNFRAEALAANNKLRQLHNASDLEFDDALSNKADEWAYVLSRRGSLGHDASLSDGENLYYSCNNENKTASAKDAIYKW